MVWTAKLTANAERDLEAINDFLFETHFRDFGHDPASANHLAAVRILRIIDNLERADGTEITVVTVLETAPAESPKTFATELFNYWGIGKAELDNGILFLISADFA